MPIFFPIKDFDQAVSQFNTQYFFECHDTLEEIWLSAPAAEKDFYQGILHVAVGFYHFENENYKGALSQLKKAKERLNQFLPEFRGVRLKQLLYDADPFRLSAKQKMEGGPSALEIPEFPSIVWEKEKF